MEPLVSIIIPVYNSAKYLEQTIQSAIAQTYRFTEIIIVDDGSTDNSFQIAEKYVSFGIKLVKQVNLGASSARNHGLRLATGEYIQFLDADDLLDSKKIESQVHTITAHTDLHLIGGIWRRFDVDPSRPYLPMPYREEETRYFEKVQWLIDRPYMIPHVWLVSNALIQLSGLWNETLSFNDDGEFFYRIIAASKGVIVDHKAIAYYRTGNKDSLSNRKDRVALLSWIESIRSYKHILSSIAGEQGNESVNRYFYEIAYNCAGKYEDLFQVCKSEMYQPDAVYNLSDNLVFYLSKIVGLSAAKRVRTYINDTRETKLIKTLILRTKNAISWQSF